MRGNTYCVIKLSGVVKLVELYLLSGRPPSCCLGKEAPNVWCTSVVQCRRGYLQAVGVKGSFEYGNSVKISSSGTMNFSLKGNIGKF